MGFDAGGAGSGAAMGSGFGPWGAIAGGLLGGFLGNSQGSLPPELAELYKRQMAISGQLQDYSKAAPMSLPQEQMALAQDRGLLGEQQRNDRQNLYAGMNPLFTGGASVPDSLNNIGLQQTGQQMSLNAQHVLASLQDRRQALLQASGVAQAAFGPAMGPRTAQPDFPSIFGNLAQIMAYNQTRNQGGTGTGAAQASAQAVKMAPGIGLTTPAMTPSAPSYMPTPGSVFGNMSLGSGPMAAAGGVAPNAAAGAVMGGNLGAYFAQTARKTF